MKRILIAALAAFALAACVGPQYVTTDVVRMHTLPTSPTGQTFVIATVDADQSESLSFRKYADTVTAKLSAMGLRPAASGSVPADYVVTLNYSVHGPTPDVQRYRSYYDPWIYDPFFWGPPRVDDYTSTRQLFARRVEINIYKGNTYDTSNKERVFEGRALSVGQRGQLEPVMPYILDALFKDFPGRSGDAQRVFIEVPPDVDSRGAMAPPMSRGY